MEIDIDPHAGFCFGVVRAIELAEERLARDGALLCLGDIVHNEEEVARLSELGLQTIYPHELCEHHDRAVLFRAHGEPPSTYHQAQEKNLEVVDATCPVVLKLQQRVAQRGEQLKPTGGQIVIYGKRDHAEVNGLLGQTNCRCFVVQEEEDLDQEEGIDYRKPIDCFSQTTMSPDGYTRITELIRQRMEQALGGECPTLLVHRTTCGQVANRKERIADFAMAHDAILFVSGRKSSNGRMLYEECLRVNPRTHLVNAPGEVQCDWIEGCHRVGISGATSTPRWLMEDVAAYLRANCQDHGRRENSPHTPMPNPQEGE